MIGELLIQTGQLAILRPLLLDAIVIGTGPSFCAWVRQPLPAGLRYGCGAATRWVEVDVYALGDVVHIGNVPPCVPVYATRKVRDAISTLNDWLAFPEDELPHGGSSGGMALSLACRNHQTIGLVGFDGFGLDTEFQANFRRLLRYWQSRGRRLVSLMPASAFDDLLLAGDSEVLLGEDVLRPAGSERP